MRRLFMTIAANHRVVKLLLLLVLTWSAAAQPLCEKCNTTTAIDWRASPLYVCTYKFPYCQEVLQGATGSTECSTWQYTDCGHTPPPAAGRPPWCSDLDGHCHAAPQDCTTYEQPCCSPLVINMGNGPWKFSGTSDPVLFDLAGHGATGLTTWTKRDSEIAFLALDRDGDGAITSGRELFGDWTRDPADRTESNGFVWLASYDRDGDGFVSDDDPIWPSLLLWADRNHDGVSQPTELMRVADSQIAALDTVYTTTDRADKHGNAFRYKSKVHWLDGRRTKYFDMYFVQVQQ